MVRIIKCKKLLILLVIAVLLQIPLAVYHILQELPFSASHSAAVFSTIQSDRI